MNVTDKSIDPATGTFWKSDQPEYWEVAAQAWRETAAFGTRQETTKKHEIARCESRARQLRA